VLSLLERGGVPFVYGGSKESLYGSALAFHDKYGVSSKHILISGKPNLNRALESDKLTSENVLTLLNKRFPSSVTLFGAHQQYFPSRYPFHLFTSIPFETIREHPFTQTSTVYTQAGSVFNSVLNGLEGPVHVSLTV
jgi:hypothetical protein